jgi:hypothetical protein
MQLESLEEQLLQNEQMARDRGYRAYEYLHDCAPWVAIGIGSGTRGLDGSPSASVRRAVRDRVRLSSHIRDLAAMISVQGSARSANLSSRNATS